MGKESGRISIPERRDKACFGSKAGLLTSYTTITKPSYNPHDRAMAFAYNANRRSEFDTKF
jgi:hypothetical protein